MSPETRREAQRPSLRREALLGAATTVPVALVLSQVNPAAYRSGAAAVAYLVAVGLATRWDVALGAAPVLWLATVAQTTDDLTRPPSGREAVGLAVVAASLAVVVLALRRWEGDRRQARDEARARMRNERRLQALVDLARHLASVATRAQLLGAVERQVPRASGAIAVLVVSESGGRLQFPVTAGYPARQDLSLAMSGDAHPMLTPALDVLRSGIPRYCGNHAELVGRYPALADYVAATGHAAWSALPAGPLGAVVLSWPQEQVFSPAQRAFLASVANLLAAAAERIGAVERSHLERFVAAFDAMVDAVGIYRAVRNTQGAVVDFAIEYLNPAAVATGQGRTELIGRTMTELGSAKPRLSHYARVVETGEPFVVEDAEVSGLATNPAVEVASIRASRLDDERVVLVVRDMTERAHLVRRVQDANAMLSVAQELAHVGSWRYDFRSDRLEWSPELHRIVGVPLDAPPLRPHGGSLFGVEHPGDRGAAIAAIDAALEQRAPFSFDLRIIRQSDGEVRELSTTGIVETDSSGVVTGIRGATQDVTERRRAERLRRAALDALNQERAAVTALQRVILPPELPEVPGIRLSAHYRAAALAHAVGGDWYDAFVAPDGRLVLAVGDVAGHGIECASLANELRVSLRIRVNDGMEPAAILELADSEADQELVTCWLGIYDPHRRHLSVANAGHPPAVLLRGGTAQVVAGRTRPPLGTQRGGDRHEHHIDLGPGDLLAVFTDGLVERRGETLDRGLERLRVAAPSVAGLEDPALALVDQLGPADSHDDVCVLTMRID